MFLDVAPSAGSIGAVFAAGFFLMFLAVAFVAYKALTKAAKMGVRMGVVAIILLIAVVGSASLWWFSQSGGTQNLKPPANRTRRS